MDYGRGINEDNGETTKQNTNTNTAAVTAAAAAAEAVAASFVRSRERRRRKEERSEVGKRDVSVADGGGIPYHLNETVSSYFSSTTVHQHPTCLSSAWCFR